MMDAFTFLSQELKRRIEKDGRVCLILDGPCATGKTTLAGRIAAAFGAPVIHMDDFYVPWAGKTPERLSQPGGNADWERFEKEVTEPVLAGQPFSYRPFLPESQCLGDPVTVDPRPLVIIEGAYANHARLRRPGCLRVKLTMDPRIRLGRLKKRNPERYDMFVYTWIPLENRYFEEMATDDSFDWILDIDEASSLTTLPKKPRKK